MNEHACVEYHDVGVLVRTSVLFLPSVLDRVELLVAFLSRLDCCAKSAVTRRPSVVVCGPRMILSLGNMVATVPPVSIRTIRN